MKYRMSRQMFVLCMAGAASGMGLTSGAAVAAGDAEAGARKAIFCAYCHGLDGNPIDAAAPRLAGQKADILVDKMKRRTEFMDKSELMMQAFHTGRILNDRDMNDLAAYFSQQAVRETLPVSAYPTEK
jgi:cytochrome c553